MTPLVDKVLRIAAALDESGIPYAFGGALALAYATEEPRGTRDVDINVFVSPSQASIVFDSLPAEIRVGPLDVSVVERDEQVRLWWDDTPIDLFFAAHPMHLAAAERRRRVAFQERTIPVLAPLDLAIFKVLFDRPKDWVDLANMVESDSIEVEVVAAAVLDLLGPDDRVERVRQLGD